MTLIDPDLPVANVRCREAHSQDVGSDWNDRRRRSPQPVSRAWRRL